MSVDLRTSLNGPSPVAFRHNPGLDGVRGLGIMIVMFGHYSAGMSEWAKTRFFGVSLTIDLFFVLSGYLITALLLEEWSRSSTISMRNFYVRRGLRLLPALYVLLVVVVVLAFTTDWIAVSPKQALAEAGAAALYVYPAVLVAKGEQAYLFHLWTLSVEEWFYFLWPALLLWVGLRPGRPARLRLVVWSLGAFVAFCFLLRALGGDDGFSRLVFALRPDSLAYGTLLAFMMRKVQDVRTPRLDRALAILGPLGVIGFIWFSWFATFPRAAGATDEEHLDHAFQSWNYRLGIICAFITVLHVVNMPEGRMARALSWRPITYLGVLSYGLYLWHQPIFLALNGPDFLNSDPAKEGHVARSVGEMWAIGLGVGLLSLAVAMASRRFVELPALRLKKRFEVVKYEGQR